MTKVSVGISRRAAIVATSSLIAAAAAGPAGAQSTPTASTQYGKIRGRMNGRGFVFQGIPYGRDTRNDRFRASAPPRPWRGIRAAVDFGDQCPQVGPEWPKIYHSWINPRPETEDCLNLNVYTPALRDGRRRPVMVWFHGGAFSFGSSAMKYAEGTRLSQRGDIVVVTVNHRLNGFGHLYLAHINPDLADSGNASVLDMVQSLKWVRDNIEEFGGDPRNVTIFGQSGGGGKVSTLMATPSAVGLFHKAIVQSGSTIKGIEQSQAEENTSKVLASLGLRTSDVDQLLQIDQSRFHDGLRRAGVEFGPVVDGRTLPRHPFHPDPSPYSRNIPLMVGSTKDETTGTLGGYDASLFALTWEELPSRLQREIPQLDVPACIETLRRSYPDATASDVYFVATTEIRFRHRAIRQAERKAEQNAAPVFMYRFEWESPVDGGRWKAPHSSEHAMVWDNVAVSSSMIGDGRGAQRVAEAVSTAWIAFARSGNPGWPAFTPKSRTTMAFNTVSQLVYDPGRDERLLFSGLAPT